MYGDIHDMSTCGGSEIAFHLLDLRSAGENLLSLTQGGPLPIIGAKRSAKVQSAYLQPATRMRTLSDARHSNARHLSRYVWRNMAQCATRAKLSVNSAVSGVGLLITLNKTARTVCLFSDQQNSSILHSVLSNPKASSLPRGRVQIIASPLLPLSQGTIRDDNTSTALLFHYPLYFINSFVPCCRSTSNPGDQRLPIPAMS